ncbi:hypothetical protein B0T26DRAFT_743615 [Lasiosphaeria miniovina]|uniref:Glyoxalase/fosfomycin resistance/dioxygenase domain-containing protein n=1 Tax=Lasiosphaeria miniovina TaxID=1954250 RepID=A0AA39ZZ34_9PEZI|nr:uncharacterized protein B0T26DRAFT_743615 [Lasiosphaeria miniovina]KAK0706316.1 hypothetical protein B0T26DRAFT_743615 [Lasiosphaeria miniovina]
MQPPYILGHHSRNRSPHEFYSAVFNWKFKDTPGDPKKAEEVRQFDFNPDPTGTLATGRGGVCVYWLVKDVEQIGDAIEKAGGKMLSSTEKEGESGLYRFFEDTEGNLGGVYQFLG